MTSHEPGRLERHLLFRLAVDTRQRALESALERGLLSKATEPAAKGSSIKAGGLALRRTMRKPVEVERFGVRFYADEDDAPDTTASRIKLGPLLAGRSRADTMAILKRLGVHADEGTLPAGPGRRRTVSAAQVLAAVEASAVPRPDQLAVMLLIADAVEAQGAGFENELRGALRTRDWIVHLRSPVDGFGFRLRRMLADGAFGYPVAALADRDLSSDLTRMPERLRDTRNLIYVRGRQASDLDREEQQKQAAIAVRLGVPVLCVAERDEELPWRLVGAADIAVETGALSPSILARVIRAVIGEEPVDLAVQLPEAACARLSLADLPAAIRPGRSVANVIAAMRHLAGVDGQQGRSGEDERGKASGDGRGTGSMGRTSAGERGRHGRTIVSGSQRIEPEPVEDAVGSTAALKIETLHGFGEARDWALDLRQDLGLWQDGTLPWAQMSTKLLLSGPPGTGKTTFARALCNSLHVPLLATSVSTWLEPSSLGDVIRRMRLAFEEAVEHAPSILFIDEIDGIGSRGDRNAYSDYWNSVVNKLLELLDGAARSEGVVIVGATNNPAIIDAALRRSGRLETHIEIPLPDVEALVGILAHHIGPDIKGIVAQDQEGVR
jgi:cell division protease FtsH